MDFFEAQARAQKRTSRLVLLFGLAVIGTVVAAYVAAVLLLRQAPPIRVEWDGGGRYGVQRELEWWDPRLFAGIATGTLLVVGLASLYKWRQYSVGGYVVAASAGGRRIDPNTTDLNERRLLNVVEEMAIASGVPVPPVYVMGDEPTINAFAAGLTTSDAVVAVTRGTLEKLSRDELQGVIAHEFSHILNGDMRLNVRLSALVFGILVIGLIGRGILWAARGTRVRSRGKGGGGVGALVLAGLALVLIGYIGYFFGRLVLAAVSRQREFLADASAVQFTRNPGGITGALKKIGGYALGSSLISTKSAEIGHFFFAQGFRSGWTGWWSTHPPLEERIRAIDPQFDGRMFTPPEVVDVAHESFRAAGLSPGQRLTTEDTVRRVFEAQADIPAARAASRIPFEPVAAIASIGTLTSDAISDAQQTLAQLPERLRTAARSPVEARVVLYSLLLDDDDAVRARQRNTASTRAGAAVLPLLDELEPFIRRLGAEQRLPLLQVALPALRDIEGTDLEAFLDVLDELVHADEKVSPFEFTLQKLVARTLGLGAEPGGPAARYYSIVGLAGEIGIVLSAVACAASPDPAAAQKAFAAGASQLRLITERLWFTAETDFAALDRALDKLAAADAPIKQQTLTAAAHAVNDDGRISIEELELLRAISATLDCPMPPLGSAATISSAPGPSADR